MKNHIWWLNPDYHFKNDLDRVCMYSGRELRHDSTPEWISFIHPTQALILGLFTDGRPANAVISELSAQTGLGAEAIEEIVSKFKGNAMPVYTEWEGKKINFPKNVLIDGDALDEDPEYDFTIEDLLCEKVDLENDRYHRAPNSVLWYLTNRCATDCKYCYADRATKFTPLPTEKILDIIDSFKALKMRHVDIIGGEVFLRRDWDAILKRLVDHGMPPTYLSTKIPVSESIAERIKASGYRNLVQVSLDSLSDRVLNATIGVKAGYTHAIKEGIGRLESTGLPIRIDTILTGRNASEEEIQALYRYVSTIRNLDLWEIRVPEMPLYARDTFREVKAPRDALCRVRDFVRNDIMPGADIPIKFSDDAMDCRFGECGPDEWFPGGRCGIMESTAFILPDGKVSACEQMYWHKDFIIGDLKEQSMEEIWSSDRAKEIFRAHRRCRPESQCAVCAFLESCSSKKRRCLVKVMKAYGPENWDYPDPRCRFAPPPQPGLLY